MKLCRSYFDYTVLDCSTWPMYNVESELRGISPDNICDIWKHISSFYPNTNLKKKFTFKHIYCTNNARHMPIQNTFPCVLVPSKSRMSERWRSSITYSSTRCITYSYIIQDRYACRFGFQFNSLQNGRVPTFRVNLIRSSSRQGSYLTMYSLTNGSPASSPPRLWSAVRQDV